MNKFRFIIVCVAVALCAVSCYDDSEILDRLSKLENSVKNLQEDLDKGYLITDAKETAEGYLLTLSNGKNYTVNNGKDGAEGQSISVKNISIADAAIFASSQTRKFSINLDGAQAQGVYAPEGWSAKFSGASEIAVKAPAGTTPSAGSVFVVATASDKLIFATLEVKNNINVLTFEDDDFAATIDDVKKCTEWVPAGATAQNYWSSLIDTKQYGGDLLYGAYDPDTWSYNATYRWADCGNTELMFAGFSESWGSYSFSSGGFAVSSYAVADFKDASYTRQLESSIVDDYTGFAGNNGSKNFCVFFHGSDGLKFADGKARIVESAYVAMSSYTLSTVVYGDYYAPAFGQESFFKVVAKGYDADGNETGVVEKVLCDYAAIQAFKAGKPFAWEKMELKSLGEVAAINFDVVCSDDCYGEYGLNTPAYFNIDDITVVTPVK